MTKPVLPRVDARASSDSHTIDTGIVVRPRPAQTDPARRLRLLTYNIQAGIATSRYHHYLIHSWKHIFPDPERLNNLDRIADTIRTFDVVGVQEVDAGSLRSGFINLTEYLALTASFPYWYDQTNRNLGRFAQHSIGLLSRLSPAEVTEVRLPGMIPGRGALMVRYGHGYGALTLLIVHLALGRRARLRQLGYISELVSGMRHLILMGDLNCSSESAEMDWLMARTDLREPIHGLHTFPSWRPQRNIDHILVSPSLTVESAQVLNFPMSDHLPIAMDVALPDDVLLPRSLPYHDDVPPLAAAANA